MKLDQDREIIEVARHTEQVTFQPSTRRTRSGFNLPMLVHERLAFSPEEYIRRYDVIQDAMARMELDALLVRGPENITYVIGYETPGYYKYHCVIIPRNGEPIFLVRDFEWLNTPEFAWSGRIAKVYDWDHPPSVTANILHQLGSIAASGSASRSSASSIRSTSMRRWWRDMPENEFLDATQILWDARMIKSEDEIEVMRRSAALVDKAMLAGYEATRAGSHRRPHQCRGQCDAVREWRGIYGAAALRARRRAVVPAAPDRRPQPAEARRRHVFRDLGLAASLLRRADADHLPRQAEGRMDRRRPGLHRRSRRGARSDQAGRDAA